MIRVVYDGNLGNNLFQYCFGRILAERLEYRLVATPISGFPETYWSIDGKSYASQNPIVLRGQKPDLSVLDGPDPGREIILTGYFQRYEYYAPYADAIKSWLRLDAPPDDVVVDGDDVVVGIRRGRDYIPRHGLPLSYYESALSRLCYRNVHICTDSPNDAFVRYLAKRHAATIRPPGAIDNLAFIKRFKKIIISNSTFLWWAAFLSAADEIVFPRPANGFWCSSDPLSKNIALEVPEPRYIVLRCEPYRSEFAGEIMRNWHGRLIRRAKDIVRPVLGRRRVTEPHGPRWVFRED